VEDALHATRAAVEEGVVPGGGVALIRALAGVAKLKGDNDDQNHGIQIAKRAMEAPLREIVNNAGEEASVILNQVADGKGNHGYNAANGKFGDMVEMGILDPTKVTRTALQNAASIAGLMITTEAMVAEAPKKDEGHNHGAGAGGMGGSGAGPCRPKASRRAFDRERRYSTGNGSPARITRSRPVPGAFPAAGWPRTAGPCRSHRLRAGAVRAHAERLRRDSARSTRRNAVGRNSG